VLTQTAFGITAAFTALGANPSLIPQGLILIDSGFGGVLNMPFRNTFTDTNVHAQISSYNRGQDSANTNNCQLQIVCIRS
jgi:hypothetical protein